MGKKTHVTERDRKGVIKLVTTATELLRCPWPFQHHVSGQRLVDSALALPGTLKLLVSLV